MAQSGYTPIQLYYSSTTTNAPTAGNLTSGELAINITDGKLFYKDNANAVQVIAWKVTPATAGGTGQTSYTTGDILYASSSTALSKLNSGATGKVLTSNGASTAPSWEYIFPSGTAMLFAQTAAPTGWTKSTTHNNKALRVVSGAASSGGTVAFTTAFSSQGVSGTVGSTTLTTAQMPSHIHGTTPYAPGSAAATVASAYNSYFDGASGVTTSTGGGGSHTHSFTGTAIDLAVQYVDVIIATKD